MDNIEDTLRQTSFREHLSNDGVTDWGKLARFQDAGVPCNNRGGTSAGCQYQRSIPWYYAQDNPVRLPRYVSGLAGESALNNRTSKRR